MKRTKIWSVVLIIAMLATMRSMLSPTFVWKWESMPASASCSPIHDEFVSTI